MNAGRDGQIPALYNSFANSFRTLGWSSLGPKALEGLRPLRSFVAPGAPENGSENEFLAEMTMNQVSLSIKTNCMCQSFQSGGFHYQLSSSGAKSAIFSGDWQVQDFCFLYFVN